MKNNKELKIMQNDNVDSNIDQIINQWLIQCILKINSCINKIETQ